MTTFLGVPVKEWNIAFVGNFEESLAEVKQRVRACRKYKVKPYQILNHPR